MDAPAPSPGRPRRVAFHGFGCKLNQYEIQALREDFLRHGFEEVPAAGPADFFVVNTCTVTESADREALAVIRAFHRRNPSGQIIVTGCTATADPALVGALPGVAHVVDNRSKNRILPRVLGLTDVSGEESPFFDEGIRAFEGHARAFVKVQDGCNYFCSFCKIPYVRGRLASRQTAHILEEVRRLIDRGHEEIVLSGVCLGSYGRDAGSGDTRLTALVEEVLSLPGRFRIRLSSIDPRDTPLELARLMASSERLCPHLHLSLQSGDDRVLERMRRGVRAADIRRLIDGIRERVPLLGLSTDVIVGFPGEDEEAFGNTVRLLEESGFHRVHVFAYSPRPGTRAESLDGRVDERTIRDRESRLKGRLAAWAEAFAARLAGRPVEVLVELSRAADGRLQGYSEQYVRCRLEGPDALKGRLVRGRVSGWSGGTLEVVPD